jgi:nanoRNase/pAp phosphatase (c-di-AMP/oligoRNAs hydrolase)
MRFTDFGRVVLNRKKQRVGIDALRKVANECSSSKIKAIAGGAAISGLYAIFYDGDYFRIKNIADTNEARQILHDIGIDINNSVEAAKRNAKESLAGNDTYSNVV